MPPYDVLLKMARLFGVSTDYLLDASNNRTINADGLTDTQIEAITMIVNELKETNKSSNKWRPLAKCSNVLHLLLLLTQSHRPPEKTAPAFPTGNFLMSIAVQIGNI